MAEKRKIYVVVTLSRGGKELAALSRDAAWKVALARGWKPIEVYKKRELKEAAWQTTEISTNS